MRQLAAAPYLACSIVNLRTLFIGHESVTLLIRLAWFEKKKRGAHEA